MTTETFDYAGTYMTRERAESELEYLFAAGDVCEGERPRIERRGAGWVITLTYIY